MISSSNPIAANARVAVAAPDTSTEEKPAVNLATMTPIGTKKSPPIVGVLFFQGVPYRPFFSDNLMNLQGIEQWNTNISRTRG